MDGNAPDWPTSASPRNSTPLMDLLGELCDVGFEPQTRARSNTWPCWRPENIIDPSDDLQNTKTGNQHLAVDSHEPNVSVARKNLTYADLITHAIGSTTDKRLTVSQIYEWMTHNVPYFKDKGDSKSTSGWKNSVRHILSVHKRFLRIPKDGTKKSSWWVVNPDGKQEKPGRKRAASMETSRYEKRRERVKKRVEALRQAGVTVLNENNTSPCSGRSQGLHYFSEGPLHTDFPMSPDFRQRVLSNASCCGRLTTITEKLADSMASELTLQKDQIQEQQGFNACLSMTAQPTPPSYPNTIQQTNCNLSGVFSHGYRNLSNQECMLHRSLPCDCWRLKAEDFLPNSVTTTSLAYQTGEASSYSVNTYANAGPDEINIEHLQGGLECNIEELIQQEINIDGLLEIGTTVIDVNSSIRSKSVCNNSFAVGGNTFAMTATDFTTQQQFNQLHAQIQQQHQQLLPSMQNWQRNYPQPT